MLKMKLQTPTRATIARSLPLLGAIVALGIVGCGKPTPTKIAGTYARTDGLLVETIVLNANGNFDQTVKDSNGQTYMVSDRWTNSHRQVKFTRLYITRDVEASKALSPPELRYYVNFIWEDGVLAKNPEQGYFLRQQK